MSFKKFNCDKFLYCGVGNRTIHIVKSNRETSGNISIGNCGGLTVPKELIGKRIRIYLEVVED